MAALAPIPVVDSPTVVAPRRRGKSLTRRRYQQGYVYQKCRRKTDGWLPKEPAYLLYWCDAPGQDKQVRKVLSIGIHRTRTIAERAAAEKLEKLGVNSTQTFIETTSSITFKQQAEVWLKSLTNRKRNPIEQTTIDTRRYALDKWMYPFFGERLLADVTNRDMKEFVEHISALSAATIRDYSNIIKAVVASAINEDGEQLFPRTWNEEYIDAPIIRKQNQPSTTTERMASILREATGHYRVLYALLAGCGPLRAGEALGLEIDKHISDDCRTLYIRQKAKRGVIQNFLKTQSGERDVDLCSELSEISPKFVAAGHPLTAPPGLGHFLSAAQAAAAEVVVLDPLYSAHDPDENDTRCPSPKSPASFKISKIPQRRVTCYLDKFRRRTQLLRSTSLLRRRPSRGPSEYPLPPIGLFGIALQFAVDQSHRESLA